MATATEVWYVRLPNGRTLRARGADVVRRQLRAGRIPSGSRARRPGENQWRPVERIAEFAEVQRVSGPVVHGAANGAAPVARDDSASHGVRGLIDELLLAVDSTLNRIKLVVAVLTGIALAVGLIAFEWAAEVASVAGQVGAGVFTLTVTALASALVTRMTASELDRHRAARDSDVYAGLLASFLRILAALAIVAVVMIGLLLGVRAAVPALAASDLGDYNALRDGLVVMLSVVRVLLEIVCWPVLALAVLLLAPLFVIEEPSVGVGLRDWLGMLRRHLGRIYVYEALAFMLASVLALPLVLLVGGAAYAIGDGMGAVERDTLLVLGGAALAPPIVYLIVANVFVYINLRYEFFFAARQR